MSWLPCFYCQQVPCVCSLTYRPLPYYPPVTTTTTLKWPQETRLSDEDIERIAERVFEKVRGMLTGFSRVSRREAAPVEFDADDMERSG